MFMPAHFFIVSAKNPGRFFTSFQWKTQQFLLAKITSTYSYFLREKESSGNLTAGYQMQVNIRYIWNGPVSWMNTL